MTSSATKKVTTPAASSIIATVPLLTGMQKINEPLLIDFNYRNYEADLARRKIHGERMCSDTLVFLQSKGKSGGHQQTMSAVAIAKFGETYQVVIQGSADSVSFLVHRAFVNHTSIADKADIASIKVVGTSTGTFWSDK